MGRISDRFAQLAGAGEKALITFITAGDPDLTATEGLIPVLEAAGADIVELGVPFSDPMADGPTIQRASERALAAGTTLRAILTMVKSVRRTSSVPIVLMGYYNPVFLYGAERFVTDAVAAGVDGVLIVDLPPEEAAGFKRLADKARLDAIFLLTPTSDPDRIAKVSAYGTGFVYYVSVAGVTGARTSIADSVFSDVARIKGTVDLPVVVGFGVSDAAQAARLSSVADGVVVGSAIVKLFEEGKEGLKERVGGFVSSLKDGIRGAS